MNLLTRNNISKLTLGTAALGLPYVVFGKQADKKSLSGGELIQLARNAGITCFDTARGYGTAEHLLGNSLGQHKTIDAVIVSKFKWSAAACSDLNLAIQEASRSVRESLAQLNIASLPICLFHMESSLDAHAVQQILPQVFSHLKNEGLIETAGISLDHPMEIKYFIDQDIYDVYQIPLNIFDQRLISSVYWQKILNSDKTVFIRSVFLKGLLIQQPDNLTGNLVTAAPYLEQLRELAQQAKMSVAQFCFSYIRDLPITSSIIIGPADEQQLAENIALLEGSSIPKAIVQKAEILFKHIPEPLLTPRLWKI